MKKKILILIIVSFCANVLHAQTFEEWFRQKKTQIKYLAQQIEALKVYTGYLQNGYEVAREGLNAINNIKEGDFFLHRGHFDSLKIVTPLIRKSSRVAEIILLETCIVSTSHAGLRNAKETESFTSEEIAYLSKVYNNIMNESSNDLDQLIFFTTNGDLEMRDDERIRRIERIYLSIQDKYAFIKAFTKQAQILSIQRTKAKSETGMMRELYYLK